MTTDDYDPTSVVYLTGSPALDLTPKTDLAPVGTTRITQYEPQRIVIDVEAASDTILVLSDLDYPGWVARIDGQETPIFNANGIMRAIELPAGTHTVEFAYESDVVQVSMLVSALSFAVFSLAALGLGLWAWRIIDAN